MLAMAAFVAIAAAGCSDRQRLPAVGAAPGCRGIGLDATITGSPVDPRLVWLVTADGEEKPLVWPPGWTVTFAPNAQVIDPQGVRRFTAGDHVDGGCVEGGAVMLSPLN